MKKCFPLLFVVALLSSAGWAESPAKTTPFDGKPHRIPGLVEAEHYDKGKAGVAYKDVDPQNRGADYREATEVDIEKRDDASNDHGIGWTKKGEWLIYTVEVKSSGAYTIEMPVASKKKGGIFHIEMNGRNVTGPIDVPDTGSWQQLRLLKHSNVKLKKGSYKMKVVMDSEGPSGSIADIDYFKFVKMPTEEPRGQSDKLRIGKPWP